MGDVSLKEGIRKETIRQLVGRDSGSFKIDEQAFKSEKKSEGPST